MEEKYPHKYPSNGNMITFRTKEISIKVMYPIANVTFYGKNGKLPNEFIEVVLPEKVLIKFDELEFLDFNLWNSLSKCEKLGCLSDNLNFI